MSDANDGWGGEVWLSSDLTTGNLVELVEVTDFSLPDDEADEYDVTHLKSPGRRKEFKRGLIDGGMVDVKLNYIPGSDTDENVRTAKEDGAVRAVRFIVPDDLGEPEWQVDTFAFVKGYPRGPVQAGAKMEATVRLRITGAQSEEAAA